MILLKLLCTIFLITFVILENDNQFVSGLMCERTPQTTTAPKTAGDGGFKITINGNLNAEKFVPGAVYTVKIEGTNGEKFSGFLLVAESADGIGHSNRESAGTFKRKDDSPARFSEFCPDAVKQSSEIAKSEISVLWTAPSLPARCVNFRATVVKSPQQWYMDDDQLTKTLCSENADVTDEGELWEPCKACEEAKYEMTFEGLWSGLTHPKDFPSNEWKPQFKDLIGASHSRMYNIWREEGIASDALQNIAERDDPRLLESELKDQSANIRTIIKARGIEHTNVQGLKTYAIFRADRDHNLISFVSRIDPSPDWFVGVSGLNLCTRNGSWVTDRTVQLFPWDAGTDSGITYLDRDMPTMPRHRIRKMVWSNDVNSPFYDPDGNMIKPFATLHIQQLRSYKRSTCDSFGSDENGDDEFDDDDAERPECAMNPWSAYTDCSVECGQGVKRKFRTYVNERGARIAGCRRKESKEMHCYNTQGCNRTPQSSYDNVQPHSFDSNPYGYNPLTTMDQYGSGHANVLEHQFGSHTGFGSSSGHHSQEPSGEDACAVTEWGPWSSCQDPCGKGVRFQSRKFKNPQQAAAQGCETRVEIKNKARCPVAPECSDLTDATDTTAGMDPDCEVSRWRDWTPCSVTCGQGIRILSRVYKYHGVDHSKCNLVNSIIEPCQGILPTCEEERTKDDCYEPKSEENCGNNFTKWFFDRSKMRCLQFTFTGCTKHKNNFDTREECEALCGSLRDDVIRASHSSNRGLIGGGAETSWGQGSYQSMSPSLTQHQGNTFHQSRRMTTTLSPRVSNAGNYYNRQWTPNRSYSLHQYGTSSTNSPFSLSRYGSESAYNNDGPPIDCKMSPWSQWSKCSASCGRGYKYQIRYVQVFNQNGGKPCPTLTERTRSCKGTNCTTTSPSNRDNNNMFSTIDLDDYNYPI